MSMIKTYRQLSNLDMITTSNIKKRGLTKNNFIVFVNSPRFLMDSYYSLQMRNVKYAVDGMLEEVWDFIRVKKYSSANKILDTILKYSKLSSRAYFYKFIVSLFEEKEAYQYLKKSIETKIDNNMDDYFRLYLSLYNEFIDISDDYELLLELLKPRKKLVAFNKNSYNGKYLDFLDKVSEREFLKASKYLDKCMEMKLGDIFLEISKYLIDRVIKHSELILIEKERQEKELDKIRCQNFINCVKEEDINGAKKALKRILEYRNIQNKNNYIYYLFLEVIEMIEMVESDLTFEVMPVTYNYLKENDLFYTFNEAIAIGDFKKAYEIGKKCRGKSLDKNQPIIKVNVYIKLLDYFYKKIEDRQKEMDNIYLIIQNNILRGQYRHALELYEANSEYLKNYQQELIYDLFNQSILFEKNEVNYIDYPDVEKSITYDISDEELEEVPIEVMMQEEEDEDDSVEEQLQLAKFKIEIEEELKKEEQEEEKIVEVIEKETTEEKVQSLLQHVEPQAEYFIKYKECLEKGLYLDARMWLDNFSNLLKDNNFKKRLDYYYYLIELGIKESKLSIETRTRKKDIYSLAYNAMRNEQYEQAISYLNYYIEIDNNINVDGYLLAGHIFTLIGNYNLAIENFIRANSVFPNPDAYFFLGELYFKKHKWNDAIFCYLAYNEFYPKENTTVYLNLSECYKRVGKTSKVVKYLHIAEEINIEQNKGLYLKNRILKAEMLDKKKKEHFNLQRKNNRDILLINSND